MKPTDDKLTSDYKTMREFKEVVAGLQEELQDPFEPNIVDGFDTLPRPVPTEIDPELNERGNIPLGHIAFLGDNLDAE